MIRREPSQGISQDLVRDAEEWLKNHAICKSSDDAEEWSEDHFRSSCAIIRVYRTITRGTP